MSLLETMFCTSFSKIFRKKTYLKIKNKGNPGDN